MALKLNTQFPDILIALNIQPHNILLLRAEHYRLCSWAWDCRNCIWIVYCVFIGWYFSKQDPLWSGTMQNLLMYLVSFCFLCAAHTLHSLAGYVFFPSPPATSICILKSPDSLPGRSCLGPLGVDCFSDTWRSSELDLVVFWSSDIQHLPNSCRKFYTLLLM